MVLWGCCSLLFEFCKIYFWSSDFFYYSKWFLSFSIPKLVFSPKRLQGKFAFRYFFPPFSAYNCSISASNTSPPDLFNLLLEACYKSLAIFDVDRWSDIRLFTDNNLARNRFIGVSVKTTFPGRTPRTACRSNCSSGFSGYLPRGKLTGCVRINV